MAASSCRLNPRSRYSAMASSDQCGNCVPPRHWAICRPCSGRRDESAALIASRTAGFSHRACSALARYVAIDVRDRPSVAAWKAIENPGINMNASKAILTSLVAPWRGGWAGCHGSSVSMISPFQFVLCENWSIARPSEHALVSLFFEIRIVGQLG